MAGHRGFTAKKNLLLKLDTEYAKIKKTYAENHRRNIAKAEKAGLHLSTANTLKDFQKFYLGNIDPEKENFKPKHEKIFKTLSTAILVQGKGEIITIAGKDENPAAASLLIHHQNRIINIINTSSAAGKRTGASHLLFDKIIEKFSVPARCLILKARPYPVWRAFMKALARRKKCFTTTAILS